MALLPSTFYRQLDRSKEHERISKKANYTAGRGFLRSTTWTAENEYGTKTLSGSDGHVTLHCLMIGTVSKNDLYVSPSGDCVLNGNPGLPSVPLAKARVRFSLIRPTNQFHQSFVPDFDRMVDVTKILLAALPDKNKSTVPFMTLEEDGSHRFNFEFEIFERKDRFPRTSENLEPIEIDNYRLPLAYSTLLAQLKPAYYARRMPVRDSSKEVVAFDKHADYMTDALVQVSFALKFYTTRGLVAETLSVNVLD